MTQKQLRTTVGLVPAALATGALLIGPGSTFGLGVPSVAGTAQQATSAVQQTASTVQQTTQSAVTTVQSTAQTTEQTAVQAPAAVAPAAPAAAPAAPSAPASAPKPAAVVHTITTSPRRASVAAPKPAAVVRHVATTGSAHSVAQPVTRAAGTSTRAVAGTRDAVKRVVRISAPAVATTHTRGATSLLPCAQLTGLLPNVAGIDSLLQTVCDATKLLTPNSKLGTTRTAADPLSAFASALAAATGDRQLLLHARVAGHARGLGATAGDLGSRRGHAAAADAGARPDLRLSGAAAGRAAAASPLSGAAAAGQWSTASGRLSVAGAQRHGGGLLGDTPGTRIVTTLLLVNLALIAAIVLWKSGRRLFAPRVRLSSGEGFQPLA